MREQQRAQNTADWDALGGKAHAFFTEGGYSACIIDESIGVFIRAWKRTRYRAIAQALAAYRAGKAAE